LKNGPSKEAMKAFYEAVEPALIRIAKELKEGIPRGVKEKTQKKKQ
jgi:hypothetical protein